MLTGRGQQHSLSTQERVFLGKCQSFWDRKCLDLRGTRTPNLRIHAEFANALTYWAIRARHLLSHVVEYWLWRCRYLWSKVNIWNINCARATAFIFDTQALIWNLKVMFMGVVIGQGNAVSTVSNWFTSFFALHQFDQQFMIYNYLKSDFEKSMSKSWVRLYSSSGTQPMHFRHFVVRNLDKLFVRYGLCLTW